MSTHSKASTSTCKHCTNSLDDYYAPGYCSEACYHAHQGQSLLNTVQHSHTHCSNCGTRLKEIEEPTDEALKNIDGYHSTTCVVGYQYRTPAADTGEVDVKTDVRGRETIATATICGKCGNANQQEVFPEDHDRHQLEYASRILDSLREQREQGVHNKRIDESVFFDTLLAGGELAKAVGKAIQ